MNETNCPVRLLILMPWGRVGSNLLVMMLQDSLPNGAVRIANEPFLRKKDAAFQSAWLGKHFEQSAADTQLIGCKSSMRTTADPVQLARDIEELGIKLVRHRRDNLVKVAVSVLRGRLYAARALAEKGQKEWGVGRGEEPLPPTPLDPETFVTVLRNAVRADALLVAFVPDCPIFDLDYEQLHAAPEGVAGKVLDWLGLAAFREAHPRFSKATADNLADAVPNLDELRVAARAAGLGDYDEMFTA